MGLISDLFLILTQNLLFSSLLGFPSLVRSAEHRGRLLLTGLLTALFCTLNTGFLAMLRAALPAENWEIWLPFFGVLLNGMFDLLLLVLLAVTLKQRGRKYAPLIHAAAFSSAVLGTMLQSGSTSFFAGCRYGLQCGTGYLLACAMLAAAAPVLCSEKMPRSVRGWRGMMLYVGVIALAITCMTQ